MRFVVSVFLSFILFFMSMHLSETAGRGFLYEKDGKFPLMMWREKTMLIESKRGTVPPGGHNEDTNIPKHRFPTSTINQKTFAKNLVMTMMMRNKKMMLNELKKGTVPWARQNQKTNEPGLATSTINQKNFAENMSNKKMMLIESKKGAVPPGGHNEKTNLYKPDLATQQTFAGHTTVIGSYSPPPRSVI